MILNLPNCIGDNGITIASAKNYRNLAKELMDRNNKFLLNIKLFDTNLSLINSNSSKLISKGITIEQLNKIKEVLEINYKLRSLLNYIQSSIEEFEKIEKQVINYSFDNYCNEIGFNKLNRSIYFESPSFSEWLNSLDLNKSFRYHSLISKSVEIGSTIHPSEINKNNLNESRKEYNNILNNRLSCKGEGINTLIYEYVPTISEEDIDNLFLNLSDEHRHIQSEINKIKFEYDEYIKKLNEEHNKSEIEKANKFKVELYEHENNFKAEKLKFQKLIKTYKIKIPDNLKPIIDFISKGLNY